MFLAYERDQTSKKKKVIENEVINISKMSGRK